MIDLEKIYKECVQECKRVNIPIQDNKIIKIEFVNENIERFRGLCVLDEEQNTFSIFLNSIYSKEDCPIEELKEIIIHELIHTCPKCKSHSKTWMKYAKLLNNNYELMVAKDYDAIFHKDKPILHRYICKNCGSFFNIRKENENYFQGNSYFVCPFCRSLYYEIT